MADESPSKQAVPSHWFVIIIVAIIGGLYIYNHHIPPNTPLSLQEGDRETAASSSQLNVTNNLTPMTTMTIATWDLTPLHFEKLADDTRSQRIADVVSQFDLIAVQGVVRSTNPLDEIVRRINAKGKKYAYVIPKNIGGFPEYVAFLFDTEIVKYDPDKTYDIVESSLSHRPLVASFCTVQPPSDKAFTFILVNVKIPDDRKDVETKALGRVFRQVRDLAASEQPPEDDIIMLGNFGLPVMQIDSLRDVPYLVAAHDDLPTTIDEMDSTENIVFDKQRTVENRGGAKRVDLIKLFDLKLSEVAAIAEHFPISAEFSVFEF